jgi:hypothetical protein
MSTTAAVGIRIENTTQTTNVAEGEYNVTAYTLGDANYTENSTTYWLTVTGDSTAPAIRVYVYQNGTIKRPETTFAINISVTDTGVGAAGTCNITINSTSVENITLSSNWCNGTVTVPTRAKVPVDGNYTINITIKDTNGNLGVNASYVVTVDNTPPILSITSPVNGTYNKSDTQSFVWFNGTVSDNINMSTGNVSINGTFEVYGFTGVNASEFNVRNSSAIANGEVLLIFNYTDYAGNVGNASAYFYLDNTAPATVKGVVNSTIGDYQPNSTQVINVQVADNMQTNDSIIFNYYTSVNLTTLTSVITGAVGTTTVYTTTIDTSKLTTNSKVWYWVTGVDNATNSISSSVGGSVGTPLQNIKIDENCGNEGLGWTNGLCKSETDMTGWAYLPVGRASMVNAMGSLGGNRTTPKVLASISGNYSYVYYYNGSSWFSYDPSLSWSQSDLKYMNQSAGSGNYFINMTSRDVIRIMPA